MNTIIEIIKAYTALHRKNVKRDIIVNNLLTLQKAINNGSITSNSPYAKEIDQIQDNYILLLNYPDTKHFYIEIDNLKTLTDILHRYEISHKLNTNKTVTVREFTLAGAFDFLQLSPLFAGVIGKPTLPFKMGVWGTGGSGKSTFSILFAKELASLNIPVLYIANEEKGSYTLFEKFKRLKVTSPLIDIAGEMPSDVSKYQAIFIDSVTSTNLTPQEIENLYKKGKTVIFVMQATKIGTYKGKSDYQHISDVFLQVDAGKATTEKSRYGGSGTVEIFTPLGSADNEDEKINYIVEDNRKKPRKPVNRLQIFKKNNIVVKQLKHGILDANTVVKNVPVDTINIAVGIFQNRKKEFSEESVNRIIEAVNNNTFRIEVFDPVLLWKEPETGKLYILSGHSRTEAFRRLAKTNKDFKNIPAKIISVSKDEAIKIALNSNTLATRETDVERAVYYRNLRKQGLTEKEIKEEAINHEGKNANYILSLSYLNPKGKAIEYLETLTAETDKTSQEIVKSVANWLGEVRKKYKEITDEHENELTLYMINEGGYGSKAGQINSKILFQQKVDYLIKRQGYIFDPTKPLNVHNLKQRSDIMKTYDVQLETLEKELKEAKKTLDTKRTELLKKNVSPQDLKRILEKYETDVTWIQRKIIDLKGNYDKYIEAEKMQKSLFGLNK
ncbi:MAG: ParB N-terminal domain-containing protein [Bacteroidales bacterium]